MRGETQFYDTLYDDLDNPNVGFIQRKGLWLLYLMDLSENMWRTADFVARRIPNGLIALILVPIALIINNALGAAALVFDINSTLEFTEPFVKEAQAVAAGLAAYGLIQFAIRWLPTSVTLFPTAMEMLGSKFAKFGTPAWQIAVWTTALFDLITDAPKVRQYMEGSWVSWTHGAAGIIDVVFGGPVIWAGTILYYVVFTLALLSASYIVEGLFICSVLVTVMLLIKSIGYWCFGLVIGLLAGKNWGNSAMGFIYKMFGTMEAPPPETGPRGGRRERRGGGRGRGGRRPDMDGEFGFEMGGRRSRRGGRPQRPPFEGDEDDFIDADFNVDDEPEMAM